MYTPWLMEKVRLTGINEVYFVTRVDPEGKVVDLLPVVCGIQPLRSVPFSSLETIPRVSSAAPTRRL